LSLITSYLERREPACISDELNHFRDVFEGEEFEIFKTIFLRLSTGKSTPKEILAEYADYCTKKQVRVFKKFEKKILKRPYGKTFAVFSNASDLVCKYSQYVRRTMQPVISKALEKYSVIGFWAHYGSVSSGYADGYSDLDDYILLRTASAHDTVERYALAASIAKGFLPCGSWNIQNLNNIQKASYYDSLSNIEPFYSPYVLGDQGFIRKCKIIFRKKLAKLASKNETSFRMLLFRSFRSYYKKLVSFLGNGPFINIHDLFKALNYFAESWNLSKSVPAFTSNRTFRRKVNRLMEYHKFGRRIIDRVGKIIIAALEQDSIAENGLDKQNIVTRRAIPVDEPEVANSLADLLDFMDPDNITFEP